METSIPISKQFLKEAKKVTNIKSVQSEDKLIAGLAGDPRWEALKGKLKRKIEVAKDSQGFKDIKDFEVYGFKCALSNLVANELQSVIDDVEVTNKVLKENGRKK